MAGVVEVGKGTAKACLPILVNSTEVSSHYTEVKGLVVGTLGERLASAERTLKPAELVTVCASANWLCIYFISGSSFSGRVFRVTFLMLAVSFTVPLLGAMMLLDSPIDPQPLR